MLFLRKLAVLPVIVGLASAKCECGYSVDIDNKSWTFTDMLESDLVHLNLKQPGLEYGELGWAPQQFNVSKTAGRGPHGEIYSVDNVKSNIIGDDSVFTGDGQNGGPAGLQLLVGGSLVNDMVMVSEVATANQHYTYGTYRASIKVTDVPGTCTAFFWYFNDTQEIDIEFLSYDFNRNNKSFPVNLVLQSTESAQAGHDASGTKDFKKVYLPFDPTADFHEYRFDYVPGKVTFYADGKELAEMTGDSVPTTSGHLLMSHWSNGNPGWSHGPPTQDAISTVNYVKAYFNSSDAQRKSAYAARCTNPASPEVVCAIPNNDPTFFFGHEDGMAPGQTVYTDTSMASSLIVTASRWLPLAALSLLWRMMSS
ncbi:glycoside hydrolase family 16 protein [Microdochium trichocladiopsis]|uniref:Glycoside hydrolase family 16 protein n=1 Tax=Microdochium trichocladiopsis TaxID=1682393 RepID=A0A9P9C0N2_9PEZI|nr:glycoside hydrolase family 16 protein [Microdochium trichocladiopsis]KAH7041279.1 glycoside hydrolase family 16 protein [Microdochium trichocladiopsis]